MSLNQETLNRQDQTKISVLGLRGHPSDKRVKYRASQVQVTTLTAQVQQKEVSLRRSEANSATIISSVLWLGSQDQQTTTHNRSSQSIWRRNCGRPLCKLSVRLRAVSLPVKHEEHSRQSQVLGNTSSKIYGKILKQSSLETSATSFDNTRLSHATPHFCPRRTVP